MSKKVKTAKTKAVKSKAPAATASLDAEAHLLEIFPKETVEALKGLIVKSFQSGGYVAQELERRINEPEVEPKADAKEAKPAKIDKGYAVRICDEDEEQVGVKFIKAAAKALKNEEFTPKAWVVVIDGQKFSPRAIYRKAFEAADFKVDWEYNTHRALSWLEHHGFPVQRV